MTILPLKYLLFNRYSLQSVTIRENIPLENNPVYDIQRTRGEMVGAYNIEVLSKNGLFPRGSIFKYFGEHHTYINKLLKPL